MSGVTLAVIGDVHASWERLERVLARIAERGADGVLLVGDLGEPTPRWRGRDDDARRARYLASVERILALVGALGRPFAWVPGNHDLPDVTGPGGTDGAVADVAGVRVLGIGGAGPARFGFPYEWGEDEIRARPEPACDVILAHCPPSRTALDFVPGAGEHVGSDAIRERALRHDGVLVCGHIHESPSAEQLGNCLCLNVGGLGAPYGRAQVGFVAWDADGGRHVASHEDLESGVVRTWTREARFGNGA
jgi:Icc-related predicted phosphoesterase